MTLIIIHYCSKMDVYSKCFHSEYQMVFSPSLQAKSRQENLVALEVRSDLMTCDLACSLEMENVMEQYRCTVYEF